MQCPTPYRPNIQVECFTVVMINHKFKELQKNSHIRHCAQTADITDIKRQSEVTLYTAQIVATQYLQHCIPWKHG